MLFFLNRSSKLQINHITSIPFLENSCLKFTRRLNENVDVFHEESYTFIELEDTSWCASAEKKMKKKTAALVVRLQLV